MCRTLLLHRCDGRAATWTTYVSSYYSYICVLMLLLHVSSYYYIGATGALRHGRNAPHLPYAGTQLPIQAHASIYP